MMRGTVISVSIDSTRTDNNQFGSVTLYGIIMSMTDENGLNLLPDLPYFVSATPNQQQQLQFGPPPGAPPGQFSAIQADASTNKTCTLTPSLIDVEVKPQQIEGHTLWIICPTALILHLMPQMGLFGRAFH